MTPITPAQWDSFIYFNASENWGDPNAIDYYLVQELDRLRQYIGRKIIIHCGYELRDGKGFHPLGLAVDCHAENMHPMEFYIAATRFNFGGIGIYIWWDSPGLHLDKRPINESIRGRATWGSTAPNVYMPLDVVFIQEAVKLKIGE